MEFTITKVVSKVITSKGVIRSDQERYRALTMQYVNNYNSLTDSDKVLLSKELDYIKNKIVRFFSHWGK